MAGEFSWSTASGFLTNDKLTKVFQEEAQPLTRFRQFVTIKEAFGKSMGQNVNWLKAANVSTIGGRLVETNTMHETKRPLTLGTLTVDEYGNSIPFTSKISSLSEFEIRDIIRGGLLDDSVKVIDAKVESEFNNTPLRYVGTNATGPGAITTNSVAVAINSSVLNSFHVRKMRLELEKRNVPTFDTGDYVMIVSLEAAESLEGAIEAVQQYTETGFTKIMNGEIGRMHGVRFVKDGWATRFNVDTDARTSSLDTWSNSLSLNGYMFGRDTVREAVVIPEEIRQKVVTDYGRSLGLAWYGLFGWRIEWETENDARIIKWDSAS